MGIIYNNMGNIYMRNDRINDAIINYRKAVDIVEK
jgi:hypothetical protein